MSISLPDYKYASAPEQVGFDPEPLTERRGNPRSEKRGGRKRRRERFLSAARTTSGRSRTRTDCGIQNGDTALSECDGNKAHRRHEFR